MAEALFCHANGFPGGTYTSLLAQVTDVRWHVLDRVGHGEYPIDSHWNALVDEVIAFAQSRFQTGLPKVVVGHSLGGLLAFFAAHRRPDLFSAYIVIDPPLINGWSAWVVGLFRFLGLGDRLSPAGRTLGRREQWPSRDDAAAYFRKRGLWAAWDDASFADWMRSGVADDGQGGVQLRFDVAREIAIYRTTPLTAGRVAYNPALCGALLLGESSDVVFWPNLRRLASKHHLPVHWLPGSHMFPMEHPQATAQCLGEVIRGCLHGRA